MNKSSFLNIVRFVALILLQVLLLNQINLFGYINPLLYIVLILFLPPDWSRWKTMLAAFFIGLTIDFFGDSGGIHATACLVIAYLRPVILSFAYGLSYDNQTLKFFHTPLKERLIYVSVMVLLHHLVLFSLIFFNLSHWTLILKNLIFSGIFTTLLILITTAFFQKAKK